MTSGPRGFSFMESREAWDRKEYLGGIVMKMLIKLEVRAVPFKKLVVLESIRVKSKGVNKLVPTIGEIYFKIYYV